MRVVIEAVSLDKSKEYWMIDKREYPEDGDDPDKHAADSELLIRHKVPVNTISYRAAEYGITDMNIIVDMIVCEPYVEPDWWLGDDHLFAAGSIDEARRLFIAKIASIKLKYRISTRGRSNPTYELKSRTRIDAVDAAVKSMGVLLNRHRSGAQTLDPHVARSLQWMEAGLTAGSQGQHAFIEEGI
jgi:hypothetical protein